MAWTTPKTWTAGNTLTAAELNEQVRDNLEFLFNKPQDLYTADEAANYTTTSTTFVDVDASNLSLDLTTSGGDVLIWFYGNITTVSGVRVMTYFDVDMDGSRVGGDDGIIMCAPASISTIGGYSGESWFNSVAFVFVKTGVSAGSHTFKLQWKGAGAFTSVLLAGAGTTDNDVHPQFGVREL